SGGLERLPGGLTRVSGAGARSSRKVEGRAALRGTSLRKNCTSVRKSGTSRQKFPSSLRNGGGSLGESYTAPANNAARLRGDRGPRRNFRLPVVVRLHLKSPRF